MRRRKKKKKKKKKNFIYLRNSRTTVETKNSNKHERVKKTSTGRR